MRFLKCEAKERFIPDDEQDGVVDIDEGALWFT